MCKKYEIGTAKFVKGQVWLLDEPEEVTKVLRNNGSHVINGRRPYVIIKVNGGIVQCCPMTTNTVANENNENDIVFVNHSSSDVESRIIVDQLQPRGTNEFKNYLYTFDKDAIDFITNRIKEVIFGLPITDGPIIKKEEENTANDIQEETAEEPVTEENPKAEVIFLPDEVKQLEMRLQKYFKKEPKHRKREAIFRTQREGIIYMEVYHDMPVKEQAKLFGTDAQTIYRMRGKAKEAAYRPACKG